MKVTAVKHIKDYLLEVTFSDGEVKKIDLATFLRNAQNPMTTAFRNKKKFARVEVVRGYLSWADGQMDLSAESLYNWKD